MYATLSNIVNRFGQRYLIQLTDPSSSDATFTANELNGSTATNRVQIILDGISSASATIDGYLRAAEYSVPITAPVPREVTDVACDIATYIIAGIHGSGDFVIERYTNAISFLKSVQRREIMLNIPKEEQPNTPFSLASRRPSQTLTTNVNTILNQL